jgi:glycogen debranching enzyme
VACAPQAWAAGAAGLMLEACLGLAVRPAENLVCLKDPVLPDWLEFVRIENLPAGNGEIDFIVRNDRRKISIKVTRTVGQVSATIV